MDMNKFYKLQLDKSMRIVVDTREQLPLFENWYGINVVKKGLKFGDYSIEGFENQIAVERKTLVDFVNCCGKERSRFIKEIQRFEDAGCEFRAIVIEANFNDILFGHWLSQIKVASVMSVINHLEIDYNFHFFYDHQRKNIEYWILSRFRRFYNNKRGINEWKQQ